MTNQPKRVKIVSSCSNCVRLGCLWLKTTYAPTQMYTKHFLPLIPPVGGKYGLLYSSIPTK